MTPDVSIITLVDFDNDCVATSLAVARALGPRLFGVRLDTSETMVDASIVPQMGDSDPRGVNAQLVRNVRAALDREGFHHVRITASGGFDPAKIRRFESEGVPVDSYGVGSSLFGGRYDFTGDIVGVDDAPVAKKGRAFRPNPRLERVE
jgi:nicotinate phosphoribosyltransferase